LEFAIALLLGVIASLIAQLAWNVYAYKIPIIQRFSEFSLSGIYAARFSSSMVEGEFVELVKIRQYGDKINLYMENYNSKRFSIWRHGGNGICRSSQIAITYYPLDKTKPNIGVFSLRGSSTEDGEVLLSGVFTQLIDRPDLELQTISQRYYLQRIDLPFKRQFNIFFQKPYFEDYKELMSYLESRNSWDRLDYKPDDKCKIVHVD
jgi:hypothetical protein